jgi:hypothetical protein
MPVLVEMSVNNAKKLTKMAEDKQFALDNSRMKPKRTVTVDEIVDDLIRGW